MPFNVQAIWSIACHCFITPLHFIYCGFVLNLQGV